MIDTIELRRMAMNATQGTWVRLDEMQRVIAEEKVEV